MHRHLEHKRPQFPGVFQPMLHPHPQLPNVVAVRESSASFERDDGANRGG